METGNNLKSIVYMTVNTVNNKIYVGVHITEKPYEWTPYWGCGITGTSSYCFKHPKTPFQRACKKYGLNAFKRYTLFVFDTYEEALDMERLIVNEEFIKRADTYNVALGGGSGLVPKCEIEVHQYDSAGNYVNTFRSKSQAARLLGVAASSINYAILNKTQLNGYYLSEDKLIVYNIDDSKKPQAKKVYVYDAGGNYINEFDSISQFANKYACNSSSAQKALYNNTKCKGVYLRDIKTECIEIKQYKRKNNCPVYQYSLSGDFIKEFDSIKAVKKEFNNKSLKISNAIQNRSNYLGFIWSYEKHSKIQPIRETLKKKIAQYDLDNNLIKIWDSYRECKKCYSCLRRVLNGTLKSTKGYIFKYVDYQVKDIV